jgi:ABC-type lipoprotein export system ATPase subunit
MLIAKNVKKSYNNREILKGIDLVIEDGEFVSIMGESGSGKSTLLSILSGNARPDGGTVTLDGFEISSASEKELARFRRGELGFVYQSLNLIPTLSAEDNILLPLYLSKADMTAGREYMRTLADRMGISHLLASMPEDMSGGERQRVAIARALIHHPKIIMLDEPTGSLDSKSTTEVLELISEIHREMGISIIQVTHSPDAAGYADRIIYVKDGEVASA